jgi:hypothetical protein
MIAAQRAGFINGLEIIGILVVYSFAVSGIVVEILLIR